METAYVLILSVGLFIRWLVMSGRLNQIEQRQNDDAASLTQRVSLLEKELGELRTPPQRPQPEAVKVSVKPVIVEQTAPVVVASEPLRAPLPQYKAPSFTIQEQPRRAGDEWEAIVGGNWLNKLGILVLVIGIALLLGYAVPRMTPVTLSATALAMSLGLLGGGILFERRERYRVFGRGLIGGGWATLYFTVYAMQSLEASRVIFNLVLGTVLLLATAIGMICHSLRYRSETVTGLGYFIAFVTLAITPITSLSLIAVIPLAASLLYLANRFSWSTMAVFGLLATYGTCVAKGDSAAPLWQAQLLFSIYWLLFEAFDLLRAARRTPYTFWESGVFPLNTVAFAGLSYLSWSAAAPDHVYLLAAGLAAAFLASSMVRTKVRPASSFPLESDLLERALSGGYEGPLTATAILSALAVLLKLQGPVALLGLLVEAELFFLAGIIFRVDFPRQLAAALFGSALVKLIFVDVGDHRVTAFGLKIWVPVTAVGAALCYANRDLRKTDVLYGYAGTGALALIIGLQASPRYLGLSWFVFAAVLFAFGWLQRLVDFRIQAYIAAGLGLAATAAYEMGVAMGLAAAPHHPWISLLFGAILSYAGILAALRSADDRLNEWERSGIELCASWAVTALLMMAVWRGLPAAYAGVGWLALALLLFEAGLREVPSSFRRQAYLVGFIAFLLLLFNNVLPVQNSGLWGERLAIAAASLLAYGLAARPFHARRNPEIADECAQIANFSSSIGTLLAAVALWAMLPPVAVAPAWAALSLGLLEAGLAFEVPSLRLQAQIAGMASFARLFFVSQNIFAGTPVIVSYYYQWWRQTTTIVPLRDWETSFSRFYANAAAIAAAVLLYFELGPAFTVAGWAVFALALASVGERWKIRDMRLQSYILAVLTFARSCTTFYAPEATPLRALVAAIVIACFYAAQLLSPRAPEGRPQLERQPRLLYAFSATALLSALLFREVSGGVLTISWAIEGVALIVAGFPLRDRALRLLGLALFFICVLKLFFYDLRQLETLYRIMSFIALGIILVAVSWIYTRFRTRIERYI